MNTLLITAPGYVEHEHAIVETMFGLGLRRLHLRKPGWTEAEVDDWLEALDPAWLHRIVLHDHHQLACYYYQVGGVHLNSRNPSLLPDLRTMQQRGALTVSRSCHSLDELAAAKAECDYVTLSPIFDSISKEGYRAAFSPEDIKKAAKGGLIDSRVYALGGVSTARRSELEQLGFSSAALLGSVWNAAEPVSALAEWLL